MICMIAEDWLYSYQNFSGVENTLARISHRLNRRSKNKHYDLTPAIAELKTNYAELERDFQQFFPELQIYINEWQSFNTFN